MIMADVFTFVFLILGFWLGASRLKKQRTDRLGFLAEERASTFVRPHSPILGAEDAKVTLVEFTDPACETCAAFSPYVKQLMDRNPGRTRIKIEIRVVIELTNLRVTHLVDAVTGADGETAAADAVGCLQNGALVAGPLQFLRRGAHHDPVPFSVRQAQQFVPHGTADQVYRPAHFNARTTCGI